MTDKARIKIAAGVTALFLAGISAAGLAVRDGQPQAATTATAPSGRRPTPAADEAASGEDRGVAAVLDAARRRASRGDGRSRDRRRRAPSGDDGDEEHEDDE